MAARFKPAMLPQSIWRTGWGPPPGAFGWETGIRHLSLWTSAKPLRSYAKASRRRYPSQTHHFSNRSWLEPEPMPDFLRGNSNREYRSHFDLARSERAESYSSGLCDSGP